MKTRQFKRLLKKIGNGSLDFLESTERILNKANEWLSPTDHSLNASFAKESSVLHKRNNGVNLTGRKRISNMLSRTGTLIVGETGSFKTVSTVYTTAYDYASQRISTIIFDPSGQVKNDTSGAHAKYNKEIYFINWCDYRKSAGFNALTYATKENYMTYLTKLATQLINHGAKDTGDKFWSLNAVRLLTFIFRLQRKLPKEYNNLYNSYLLLQKLSTKEGQTLINRLVCLWEHSDKELVENYLSIINQNPKTFSGILLSSMVAIQDFYLDPNLAAVTSLTTLPPFSAIRKKAHTIYIQSSTANQAYYSKISSVFFQTLFEDFFEELPQPGALEVAFILEEFPLLSIRGFSNIAANIRKYAGQLFCVVQNTQQIFSRYGEEANSILSNLRTKVILSADLQTATQLEQECGMYEYETEKGGTKKRPLIARNEVMCLPPNKGLITVSGQAPILADITPYFKTRKYKELAELPPYEFISGIQGVPKALNVERYVEGVEAQKNKNNTNE